MFTFEKTFLMMLFILVSFFNSLGLAGAAEGFDVNDVSIFLPIRMSRPWPMINLADDQLLNKTVFEELLTFEKSFPLENYPYIDGATVVSPENWFVTSLRVDPCGDLPLTSDILDRDDQTIISKATSDLTCAPLIRLVVQPFQPFGSRNSLPSAIHLLFPIDNETVTEVYEGLTALKQMSRNLYQIETTGLPLMLHPGLFHEAQLSLENQKLAQELRVNILKIFEKKQIQPAVATLILRVDLNHWKFVGGTVRSGHWKKFVTEFSQKFYDSNNNIAFGVEEISCDFFSVCKIEPQSIAENLNSSATIVTEIFKDIPALKVMQTPGHRSQELMKKAELIDHPQRVHFFNTNCISCHESSNLRNREQLYEDGNYDPGLTPFVGKKYLNASTNNILNFAYFGTIPRISTRTAAESVTAANTINRLRNVKNPAPFISDLNAFWKCVTSQENSKNCFEKITTTYKEIK